MPALNTTELERRAAEIGCLCVPGGKINKATALADDGEAIAFYEEHCRCSRTYVHLAVPARAVPER